MTGEGNGNAKMAVHDIRLEYVEARLSKIEASQERVEAILNQAQGGWRTLLMISGVSSVVGAAAAKIIPFIIS